MKYNLILCLCLLLGMLACQTSKVIIPEVGISKTLAEKRKAEIKELQYLLKFYLPEEKNDPVTGQVLVIFTQEKLNPVILDFREKEESIKSVLVNGCEVEFLYGNEHIIIPEKALKKGKNEVKINFVAGNQSLNRSEDYLYTLLVPDRARTLFPCFDQPDLKATFTLELDVPGKWTAVSNGIAKSEVTENGRKRIAFEKTQPISSYLFAFVAGNWQQLSETREGRTISLYHRETDTSKLAQTGIIFDQVFTALKWMEKYTGIPYPFEKYDLIIVPGFQFGGMEHVGAVLYNDKRMFLNEHPTVVERLGRMELIAHETAHMWFGDDVTMAWFDDVWTKEVFANYFASKMIEPQFPEVNHRLNSLRSFYPAAYSEDRTAGTNAIRQPLENLNSAGLIYGQIVYNKAPIMMGMLADLMGEENFRKGLQQYLATYAYSNATWDDLIDLLDKNTPEELKSWSQVWVDEKGMPEIKAEYKEGHLNIRQTDRWRRQLVWPQKVQYTLFRVPMDEKSRYVTDTVEVLLKDSLESLNVGEGVRYIIPNTNGQGYGYFVLDSVTASFCLQNLSVFMNPVSRLSVIVTLHENLLKGRLEGDEYTEVLLRHLEIEKEPLIISAVVGYIKEACLRNQVGSNPHTERSLLRLAKTQTKSGCQKLAFNALLDVWTLPEISYEIKRIWDSQQSYKGLILSERDYMKMAYELSLRIPEQYQYIVEKQAERITNPDRKREFCYVVQAVHSDTVVIDSLFDSLLEASNRRMEPWVAQVLYYLNHPLREEASIKFIAPALENLQEIQRTGDIFFPKNWVSSCLRGHNSPEAGRVVEEFLQSRPNYPVLLKNKILQSADHLFRK